MAHTIQVKSLHEFKTKEEIGAAVLENHAKELHARLESWEQHSEAAAQLLNDTIQWCEKQFRTLGHGQQATNLASQFIALVQGSALMTNTFKDPKVTMNMSIVAQDWLKNLRNKQENGDKNLEIAA